MKPEWLDRSLAELYCHLALCTNGKQYQRILKHLNISKSDRPPFVSDGANATVHEFTNGDKRTVVVCVTKPEGVDTLQVYSLLVHEAVHIYQWHKAYTGEENPSKECEAYAIQSIAQRLMYEYQRQVAN